MNIPNVNYMNIDNLNIAKKKDISAEELDKLWIVCIQFSFLEFIVSLRFISLPVYINKMNYFRCIHRERKNFKCSKFSENLVR